MRHDKGRGGNVGNKGLTGYQSMESPAPRIKARNPKNETGEIMSAQKKIEGMP
jgi:hypothetical protein